MKKRKVDGSARGVALGCLLEVEGGLFPEDVLERFGGVLDRRDRAFASALVYGVLRHRTLLDWTLRGYLKKKGSGPPLEVLNILRLGLFQLMFMDRIPESAAVNESVNLAKRMGPPWASGLVNGVLRSVTRTKRLPDPMASDMPEIEKLATAFSHPEWMVERWLDEFGGEEAKSLLAANNEQAPLTLRIDVTRISRDDALDKLAGSAERVEPTEYSPVGIHLFGPSRPVSELPGYDEGWFSVQDESAQAVGLLTALKPGETVLDACAGRGGKTMHLARMTEAMVIGLDPDKGRLALAKNEIGRLGLKNVRMVHGDLLADPPVDSDSFDVVLVDAPCSNLGVIRRRPDVKWTKSQNDPAELTEIQKKLLHAAAKLVKPGGRLVYAVCTHTREETLAVTDDFWMNNLEFGLKPAGLYLPESARPLVSPDGMLRARPDKHGADGFFAAVFERKLAKPEEKFIF